MHRPVSEVGLPPMNPMIYSHTSAEPQYVSGRVPNQGWMYISSQDAPEGTDRTNYIVGTSEILANNMARIKGLGFATYWNVPNVNPRNDVISFYSTAGGFPPALGAVKYTTAPLVNRWYDIRVPADEAALRADILAKLNALTGASGLTWSMTPVAGFPQTYNVSTVGGQFIFDLTSSALAKGAQMFGFPRSQVPSDGSNVTPITNPLRTMILNFVYTQFVDIVSTTLTKWDKMQSASTGRIAPLLMRVYVGGQSWGLQFHDLTNHPVEFSWKGDEPLATFDIKFFDMNGDPLYQLNGGKDWIWQLSLLAEM